MREMTKGHAVQATVAEQTALPGGYYRLLLEAPTIAAEARAGQFVHILPREPFSSAPLLRRAFSVMTAAHGNIEVVYRAVGRGTGLMSAWKAGQKVDLLGPLGRPFATPEHPVILIGGGVGIPPMVMLARQTRREHPDLPVTVLIGAQSAWEVLGKTEFQQSGAFIQVATDDGSEGHHGFVTELLETLLRGRTGENSLYACGPLPMLRRVAAISAEAGCRAQLSLEENMPCGIGVCNGCALPVNNAGEYHQYSRICVDGPALWSDQIDWDKLCP